MKIQTTFFKLLLLVLILLLAIFTLGLSGTYRLLAAAMFCLGIGWCIKNILNPPVFVEFADNIAYFHDPFHRKAICEIDLSRVTEVNSFNGVDTSGAINAVGFYKELRLDLTHGESKHIKIPFLCSDSYTKKLVALINEKSVSSKCSR